ncbi:hypothetical protein AU198_12435 [Mycobacterium sp. GA-1199]|uniref:DUF4436 family protein n=1 Tax=Mycobacterium sp. GA-1199 TaxID=1772287 RepID=UPI00074A1434|nr:DUF4436 family protein [Mycobacterium sp. GA-1199]KUI40553.1 hypothetical protein AU198_12435 [Mycobacterium sp. GA-1199]
MTGAVPSAPSGTPRRRRVTVVTTVVAVIAVYIGSLVGYALLEPEHRHFQFSEPSVTGDTVVIIRLREMNAVQNRFVVDVLLHPGPGLQTGATDDVTIRLSSWTSSGELIYVHPALSANDTTTQLVAVGDPDDWPFDRFTTDIIGVQAFSGDGPEQRPIAAGIVVAGQINGWDVHTEQGTADGVSTVRFTMERTRGALAFDVGVLLVLLALPAAALFVAIETVLGRRKFLPPLTTWFAAMLFAVVPLRNLLPGAPPAGAWIDLAVVLWVLIALAAAMVLYVVAWWRQKD